MPHQKSRLATPFFDGKSQGASLMKGGSKMLKVSARVGAGLMCAAIIALLSGGSGQAQDKDPSDNSVRTFMKYAWVLLPEKFTSPQGKTIVVDKKKPKEIDIPLDVAREAV